MRIYICKTRNKSNWSWGVDEIIKAWAFEQGETTIEKGKGKHETRESRLGVAKIGQGQLWGWWAESSASFRGYKAQRGEAKINHNNHLVRVIGVTTCLGINLSCSITSSVGTNCILGRDRRDGTGAPETLRSLILQSFRDTLYKAENGNVNGKITISELNSRLHMISSICITSIISNFSGYAKSPETGLYPMISFWT
jgi:hypothetical protein